MSHIDYAMVLAAGRGTRMRHLSKQTPKPILDVAGKSILKRILSKLSHAKINHVVINLHYLGQEIKDHLVDVRVPNITYSEEKELLETGGGVKKALPLLKNDSFFVINGDMLWADSEHCALSVMKEMWKDQEMDILLLLYPTRDVPGHSGDGDYFLESDGRIKRRKENEKGAPYIFAGARVCHKRIFDGEERTSFGFLDLFDKAEKQGKLYGVVHDGQWFHFSTPEMLAVSAEIIQQQEKII